MLNLRLVLIPTSKGSPHSSPRELLLIPDEDHDRNNNESKCRGVELSFSGHMYNTTHTPKFHRKFWKGGKKNFRSSEKRKVALEFVS